MPALICLLRRRTFSPILRLETMHGWMYSQPCVQQRTGGHKTAMKKIIPITDLQRQAGQIVGGLVSSDEPVIITRRGRPAAVLLSARRYSQLEEDLERLDELELVEAIASARDAISKGQTMSHAQVKARIEKRHNVASPRKRRAR
jgi:prevent-host-death family protein